MTFHKITIASLLFFGLSVSAMAQTRSAIVYPEDGNDQIVDQSLKGPETMTSRPVKSSIKVHRKKTEEVPPEKRVNPNYHTAQRLGDYAPPPSPDRPVHRFRKASYDGPGGERIVAGVGDLSPIPEGMASVQPGEIVHDPSTTQYEPIISGDSPLTGSDSCDGGECGVCCECDGQYCNESSCPLFGTLFDWGHKNLAINGGVHGFKGPRDRGVNGNFGFQEGLNFGSPLGDPWGCGFQLGFQALQSNITGNQVSGGLPTADRHQYFVTAGIFRRAEVGKIQWAVAFDFLHDTYTTNSNLKQIRSETGWLFNEQTEVGYWGAYGIGGDTSSATGLGGNAVIGRLEPTDQFLVYIRRYFENCGDGRLFGGVTGKGDGLFGADVWIPLSGSWALQNDFVFLIPKEGRGTTTTPGGVVTGGQVRETWGVALNLVWYPGRSSRCVGTSCYRPVLNVADNSQFLVNESFSQ